MAVYFKLEVDISETETKTIEDDIVEYRLITDLGIPDILTVTFLNYDEEWTGVFTHGMECRFYIGDGEYSRVFGGQIFEIALSERDTATIKAQGWGSWLVATRVTEEYYGEDYGEAIRHIVTKYGSGIGTDYIFDIGETIDERIGFIKEQAWFAMKRLTRDSGFDFRVRPDMNVVLMPDNYHIEEIFNFTGADGSDPAGWTEVSTTSASIQNNVYHYEASTGVNNILTVDGSSLSSTANDWIRSKLKTLSPGDSDQNFILFDYQSSTDFKYAGIKAGTNLVVIGHYDGTWNDDDTTSMTISNNTWYLVDVKIVDKTVTVYVDRVEKVDYTFASMGTGKIGLGGQQNHAETDEYVHWSASRITITEDDLEDYDLKRDTMHIMSRAEVVGGYERFEDDFSVDLGKWGSTWGSGTIEIVSGELNVTGATGQYTVSKYSSFEASVVVNIDTGTDAIIRVRDNQNNDYYYIEIDAGNDYIKLWRVDSGTPTELASEGVTINLDTDYRATIKFKDDSIRVYFNAETALYDTLRIDVSDDTYITGYFGLGSTSGTTVKYDDFVLNADRVVEGVVVEYDIKADYGERTIGPVSDTSLHTREECRTKAQYLLDLNKLETTRGSFSGDARFDIICGDIVEIDMDVIGITDTDYRVIQAIQGFNDRDGNFTKFVVAENFRNLEAVIDNLAREILGSVARAIVSIGRAIGGQDTVPAPSTDSVSYDLGGGISAVADDGGTQTDETTEANNATADDMTLLPAAPAVGDAYFFGDDEQPEKLTINISTAGAGTWTITWKYYNGTSYTPLSGVSDGTNGFTTGGTNDVTYTMPGDWATKTEGGITNKYWIKAEVTSYTSITTQPKGQQAWIPIAFRIDSGEFDLSVFR